MEVEHIAAFSEGDIGGNPAGVAILEAFASDAEMQATAARIGYSETVFAVPKGAGWRVRYFAPVGEVPFCGHATIALGAALARRFGAGTFPLALNTGEISVRAEAEGTGFRAELTSPATSSEPLSKAALAQVLALFGLSEADLDPRLPPRLAFAGASHPVLALRERARLKVMAYDFAAGRALMLARGWTTISLLVITGPLEFAARNAFASGGVLEDPATGAAAAALGGALVDIGWPGLAKGGRFTIRQGEDMGQPSQLEVTVSGQKGAPVKVAGAARMMRAAAPA